jgi:hypothetical protein
MRFIYIFQTIFKFHQISDLQKVFKQLRLKMRLSWATLAVKRKLWLLMAFLLVFIGLWTRTEACAPPGFVSSQDPCKFIG